MATEQDIDGDTEWRRLEVPGVPPAVVMLLEHTIDFAGLFPPAKQSMSDAVATYAKARTHPDAWMLERFVLQATELKAFEEFSSAHLPRAEEDEPWPLSVLVRHDADGLAADVAALEQFNDRHVDPSEGFAIADVVEIKGDSPASIEAALNHMPDEVFPFFELVGVVIFGDAGHHCRRRRWCEAAYRRFGRRRLPHSGSHGQILARCCFGRGPTERHGGNALASSSPVRRRRRGNGPRIFELFDGGRSRASS